MIKLMKLYEFESSEMQVELDDLDINTELLDKLVELVGSEEEIEEAAQLAFEELSTAAKEGQVEMADGDIPEKLAIAALLVKLVELSKIGPEEAEEFIAEYLD